MPDVNFWKFSVPFISNISSVSFSLSSLGITTIYICYTFVLVPQFWDILGIYLFQSFFFLFFEL